MSNNTSGSLTFFYNKYKLAILSFVLAVYAVPSTLFNTIPYTHEGSWIRAINMAIRNKTLFGSEFVFNLGPLGFLSTRNHAYVGNIWLILADVVLVCGFYLFFRRYITGLLQVFVYALVCMFLVRNAEYTQIYFIIFTVNFIMAVQSNFKSYYEVVFCSVCAAMMFFMKINYGIVAMGFLTIFALFALVKNIRAFALLAGSFAAVFSVIYLNVHIDLVNYFKYSIALIEFYQDAHFVEIKPFTVPVIMAVATALMILYLFVVNTLQAIKGKKSMTDAVLFLPILCLLFLLFKNAFTMANYMHYMYFFAVSPFLMLAIVQLFGQEKYKVLVFVALGISVFMDFYIVYLFHRKNIPAVAGVLVILGGLVYLLMMFQKLIPYAVGLGVVGFVLGVVVHFKNPLVKDLFSFLPLYSYQLIERKPKSVKIAIPKEKLALIGNNTIDLLPEQIPVLEYNKLNYCPRPLPISYLGANRFFDSLNAHHFYEPKRPVNLLMRLERTDNNNSYGFWNESFTKATIHLNYEYQDYISFDSTTLERDTLNNDYLLLKAKAGEPRNPVLEIFDKKATRFGTYIPISFPDSIPIYMATEIRYDLYGRLRGFIFQPPNIYMKLRFDDSTVKTYPIRRPVVGSPCLINKQMLSAIDLKNFISGNLKGSRNVVGVTFFASGPGCDKNINLTFLKFTNY